MAGGKKSANCSSEITLTVKNQDGDKVPITLNRRTQVKKLLHSYCEQKELDINSVALRFAGYFLRSEQTPNQLGMVDGDEICAFSADSLGSNVQGSTEAQSQVRKDNNPCDVQGILDIHTFDELAVRTTQSLEQAMTFLKASFHKAHRLNEDAQSSREEIKIKYDSLNEVVNVAETKVAEKDLLIVKLHRELQQANAIIRSLNKEESRRDEELLKVKQELLTAKEEILRKEVEYCTGKRAAVAGSSPNELKKARLNEPIGTMESPVARVCILNQEHKKSTDGSAPIIISVDGLAGVDPVFFKIKRSTKLKALMGPYCEREKSYDLVFYFNGFPIRDEQTPDKLEMKDGDVIDVREIIYG